MTKRIWGDLILQLFYSAANIFLPSVCPICGIKAARHPSPICNNCEELILSGQVPAPRSMTRIKKAWTCRFYEDTMIKCIHQFKYRGKTRMINIFEKMFEKVLSKDILFRYSIDLIIPVPLHKKRQRERGYNQSEIIAKQLSEIYCLPMFSKILIKTKNTVPQMKLSKKLRSKNLTDSFSSKNAHILKDKNIMLVDDVITTGTTLNTCARKLIEAGAKKVFVFTIARTK